MTPMFGHDTRENTSSFPDNSDDLYASPDEENMTTTTDSAIVDNELYEICDVKDFCDPATSK